MSEKKYTFFVLSHDLKSDYKITLKAKTLQVFFVLSLLLLVALLALVVDYFGLWSKAAESNRLRAENQVLVEQFKGVEGKLTALENSLERVKTFALKLKLITNVSDQDRDLNLSAGLSAPNNLPQFTGAKSPVAQLELSEQLSTEGEFAGEIPLDESKGEVAQDIDRGYTTLSIRIERAIQETQAREQSVLSLWESLADRQSLINATPNIKPARGWISSTFGYRTSPITGKLAMHAGLDIAASPGSPIYAPADGIVSFAGWDEGYGKLVSIDHGFGVNTRFGHNSQIYVRVGQRVSRWDVIAAVGNTGRSTGPHLHYEVRVNGIPRNPMLYILNE